MYLKTLTLRGFKSFASATTLHFEPGITCVVGPNGSGKSNVVDALSWVMGEQGAKTLRGGKMEDVIFAGTSDRPPLGRAEVELTIDNSDGALPLEFSEVTIKRTMFRSGGSEYSINGEQARLLDVQELLSDSGIGHEMHVIVGQGRLDSILQASPEDRRGFIEEAAGVLKHRKRKEKALRKLASTDANLHRLEDLLGEIRRQLKPLARQASVARKAVVIQAEARDAKARLIADELVRATLALESESAGEEVIRTRRAEVEAALEQARAQETEAAERAAGVRPRTQMAHDTRFALSTIRERLTATRTLAGERHRSAVQSQPGPPTGRDPAHLEREAQQAREQEAAWAQELERLTTDLHTATHDRAGAEARAEEAERRYSLALQDAATAKETIASLNGRLQAALTRLESGEAEIGRLHTARTEALDRAAEAETTFTARQNDIAGLDAGEEDLDRSYEEAAATVEDLSARLEAAGTTRQEAAQTRASLSARVEALRLGLDVRDATAALSTGGHAALHGLISDLLGVDQGWEAAVVAALGEAAEALVTGGLDAAADLLDTARTQDLGRAGIIVAGQGPHRPPGGTATAEVSQHTRDAAASGTQARPALDVVTCPPDLQVPMQRLLGDVVVTDAPQEATAIARAHPTVRVATTQGALVSAWWVAGGTDPGTSRIEVRAAVEEAEADLARAEHDLERATFSYQDISHQLDQARTRLEAALDRLHESDARMAAVAEELGHLSRTAAAARAEAERLTRTAESVTAQRDADRAAVTTARHRLAEAQQQADSAEPPDPAERDRLAEEARTARAAETEARLALRSAEERGRGLQGRSDSLMRAARTERDNRARAERQRAHLAERARRAQVIEGACDWAIARMEASVSAAEEERLAAEAEGAGAEEALRVAREQTRQLGAELAELTDEVHRGEIARAESRLRVEAIAERGRNELGLDPQTLSAEYGPDTLVPVLTHRDGTAIGEDEERPDPVPFVRAEQEKRLRAAERNLKVLGNVNPLALEEYEAMQERHAFLASQLEDLQHTRAGLLDIVTEVDRRVEEVFARAYADVEETFRHVFSRLFPGGEGRLVPTEPGNWLTTGVEVEARPAGKKVKRLSLLSGGERSLVAVAFLVALFIARPSPFYILDEVEAALDDTNLGRLLEIYEELRESSQLLVITHQKRTMEVADALYGVTMRGDGVSTVISQRLGERDM